jgi:hypothetical protein
MNFNTEYSILYIILAFLFSVLISFFYYKRTNTTLLLKIILSCLRTLSIFLFLLLIFLSYITINKKTTEKPINIFLIDDSKSMTIENRWEKSEKIFGLMQNIGNGISENRYYLFGNDLIKEIGKKDLTNLHKENANGESTNLTKALYTLTKLLESKKISTINILTDGMINEGGNSSYIIKQTGAIFNYFLIGDTTQKKDLSIKNIFFNPTVYTESNTQILAEFNSFNYNKEIKINLYEEDKIIQEKIIRVNSENIIYNCEFNLKSNEENIKKYKVQIENDKDEITEKNNSEEFFIEFINNKFKILVLSGNPSADFSYLSETIKSINNFEPNFYVQKATGAFYEGFPPSLDGYHLLILNNFPNSSTDLNIINKLNDDLRNVRLPVLFISGSNTDYEKLKILSSYLPFTALNKSGKEEKTSIKPINDLSSEIQELFNFYSVPYNLPEIFIPDINFSLVPEASTILYSSKFSKPVLAISRKSSRNSAAFLAYNFYKWRLNNNTSDSKSFLGKLLTGITISICEKEKNKKIYLDLEKQIYSPFESIKINGLLNNSELNNNYSAKLQIYNSTFSKEYKPDGISKNGFTWEIQNLDLGEYYVKCILTDNVNEIAYDSKKILIKESNLEFKNTKSDKLILNTISDISDGEEISENNIDDINRKINLKNEADVTYQNDIYKIYLNSSTILLFIIILLLSTEWFIRKRINLP